MADPSVLFFRLDKRAEDFFFGVIARGQEIDFLFRNIHITHLPCTRPQMDFIQVVSRVHIGNRYLFIPLPAIQSFL